MPAAHDQAPPHAAAGLKIGPTLIVGVGLMGGSIGMALAESGITSSITGLDLAPILEEALQIGAIDRAGSNLEDEAARASFIVVASPISAIPEIFNRLAPTVQEHALVTDIGSVKASIVSAGCAALGRRYVGGHPMAGSEQTGISAASSSLFRDAAWAITPAPDGGSDPERISLLSRIAAAIGARPIVTGVESHDRAAALVSHLPHLVSFAYSKLVSSSPDGSLARSLAAGSYRDLIRCAASDPELWRDVFLQNRAELLASLHGLRAALADMEAVIRRGNDGELMTLLADAGARR